MFLMAIDPGTTQSAYVIMEHESLDPVEFEIIQNTELIKLLKGWHTGKVFIEDITNNGHPVGKSVITTIKWIGRFHQVLDDNDVDVMFIPRKTYGATFTNKVKDKNISDAMRALYKQPKSPARANGVLAGCKKDIWQALALAVWAARRLNELDENRNKINVAVK